MNDSATKASRLLVYHKWVSAVVEQIECQSRNGWVQPSSRLISGKRGCVSVWKCVCRYKCFCFAVYCNTYQIHMNRRLLIYWSVWRLVKRVNCEIVCRWWRRNSPSGRISQTAVSWIGKRKILFAYHRNTIKCSCIVKTDMHWLDTKYNSAF
jgi:hypothetical protein